MGPARLILLTLGSTSLLSACGDEPATPAGTAAWSDAGQQEEDIPTLVVHDNKLAKTARAARGAGFPTWEINPLESNHQKHYQLRGTARFVSHDPNSAPIEQTLEIALASPTLQRYQLAEGVRSNWFLLAGTGDAWLKKPDDPTPQPWSAGAVELGEDAALRWLVLRFPDPMRDLETDDSEFLPRTEAWEKGEPFAFDDFLVRCNEQGLPTTVLRAVSRDGSALETPELLLEISDWTLEASSAHAPRLYPRLWVWHREAWKVEERIESVEDRALYLNMAFRPDELPLEKFQGMRVQRDEDGAPSRIPPDRFALVEPEIRYVELAGEQELAEEDSLDWYTVWRVVDGDSVRTLRQLAPGEELEGSATLSDQLCLLWSSRSAGLMPEEVRAKLIELAKQNQLEPLGPIWFNWGVAGIEALLPVQRPE